MEADAPALLSHVEQHTAAFFGDNLHRQIELLSTITAHTAEGVPGDAFAMDAHQYRVVAGDVARYQGDMFFGVGDALVRNRGKFAVFCWQLCLGDAVYQFLITAPVGNEFRNAGNLQSEIRGHHIQFR